MTGKPDPLLTIPEVAARLRVHRSTIYRYFDAGLLASIKFGNVRRIRSSELQRFLRAQRVRGAA
jgi:excisionase family DNA binding protein